MWAGRWRHVRGGLIYADVGGQLRPPPSSGTSGVWVNAACCGWPERMHSPHAATRETARWRGYLAGWLAGWPTLAARCRVSRARHAACAGSWSAGALCGPMAIHGRSRGAMLRRPCQATPPPRPRSASPAYDVTRNASCVIEYRSACSITHRTWLTSSRIAHHVRRGGRMFQHLNSHRSSHAYFIAHAPPPRLLCACMHAAVAATTSSMRQPSSTQHGHLLGPWWAA